LRRLFHWNNREEFTTKVLTAQGATCSRKRRISGALTGMHQQNRPDFAARNAKKVAINAETPPDTALKMVP
jgi:hypothetical protein